jgi:hypothetical protein
MPGRRWPLRPLWEHAAAQHGVVPHEPDGTCVCGSAGTTPHIEGGAVCMPLAAFARLIDRHPKQAARWLASGLSTTYADELGTRLAGHPVLIWTDWDPYEPRRPASTSTQEVAA